MKIVFETGINVFVFSKMYETNMNTNIIILRTCHLHFYLHIYKMYPIYHLRYPNFSLFTFGITVTLFGHSPCHFHCCKFSRQISKTCYCLLYEACTLGDGCLWI